MGGFDWGAIWYAVPYMLQGAVVTLEISLCAMVLATRGRAWSAGCSACPT